MLPCAPFSPAPGLRFGRLRLRLVSGIFIKIILMPLSLWPVESLGTTRVTLSLLVQMRPLEPSNDEEPHQGHTRRYAIKHRTQGSSTFVG